MAAKLGLRHLAEKRAVDEELICIAETDACGCDAIQVLTGCTFGKGNFIYRDIGKMAFTFASRTTGEGVRLAMKPNVMAPPAEEQELMEKMRSGGASKEEIKEYEVMHETRSQALFDGGPDAFFTLEEVEITLPQKARMAPSKLCDKCGEPVMQTKLQVVGDKQFCRDCFAEPK
jgi:formylmethanofuran dehydrogenase subunit E